MAGLVVWIIYREISRKWALLCYAAVALLALLLTPDIESKLLFTGFFGYSPVIRDLAFWLIGNFTFVCYDVCLSQLSYVYEKWLRRKVHRLIR